MKWPLPFALWLVAATAIAESVVILPFDNLSGSAAAATTVEEVLSAQLPSRGWKPVASAEIEPILEERRLRYLDSLDPESLRAVTSGRGAAVLLGTIYTWRDDEVPVVALSARLMRADGTILWGNVAGMTAADTERVLGLGRAGSVHELAERTIVRLLAGFPANATAPRMTRGPRKPLFLGGPATWRASDQRFGNRPRICILPFDSASSVPESARVVQEILAIRLASMTDVEIVEPAFFRAAMRAEGLRSFRGIGSDELAALGKRLGTPLFLRGTIYTYRDAPPRSASVPPQLQMETVLVDVEKGSILWSSNHSRTGDEYQGLLLLGTVRNAVTLADRVISEMIDSR